MEQSSDEIKKSGWSQKEEEILQFWQDNKIFEKSLEKNKCAMPFVFYDGPPFATGLPHYGSILPSVMKDVIPRYRTMKGDYVRRVWGWDCHGLPIENLIEKELGLLNKKDIEELGVGKFNDAARASVLRYDKEWKKIIPRVGRWIDMDNGYKTMDANYTESVWWGFKELHKKGLVYKDRKSMHICPRCETTLSNTEVTLGYKDITDISVYVKFELVDEPGTFLLAWTTTPWTLPGNVALAVGEDIEYVKISTKENDNTEKFIVAKELVKSVFEEKEYEILEDAKGKDLVGKKYKPVFDYFSSNIKDEKLVNRENGWKVYSGDFVTTEAGTGIVHIAPAFGEDDMALGKKYNLPFVQHVSMSGKFSDDVKDFSGFSVKPKDDNQKTDIEIIKYLAHKSLLFSKKKIIHSYPHCWRCDTPLLNYATSSWFIKVTAIKDRLVDLNKKIKWIPQSIGEGRFGNWLENARDWSVSRARFWGAPIPVWECDKCDNMEFIGSVQDIKNKTRKRNNFILMRHGQVESNVKGFVSNGLRSHQSLTPIGVGQAKSSAEALKSEKIDIIFSSDLTRAIETAEITAGVIGIDKKDIIIDERLREINGGEFEGKKNEEYHAFFSSYEDMFVKIPKGGENLSQMKKRVMDFLYEIDNKYYGKNILIVSHEYTSWLLSAGAIGADIKETVAMKEARQPDFLKNAETRTLDFTQIPHNDEYELDLHRPYIDGVSFSCDCGGKMLRVPEVFDCWVESGSMPFAQMHYPFENKEKFEKNFPADFIAEGIDQTRGWFYTMLTLSAGIFDKTPYKNVIVSGMILAEDGKKMSKKLKNYPEPWEILNKYSADALRMYILGSPVVRAEDLRFSEDGVDEIQKKVIGRVLNVLSFYKLYADEGHIDEPIEESDDVLDLWILSRIAEMEKEISKSLDKYELDRAVRPILLFVDDLSTWYLRRSRDRFKSKEKKDRIKALSTTKFVLTGFAKSVAPIMPFVAENIYGDVGGEKESVHLENWPSFGRVDNDILDDMEEVRKTASVGLEARASFGIKVRQPLSEIKIKSKKLVDKPEFTKLILDELNIENIVFDEMIEGEVKLDTKITPELEKKGNFREFLRYVQDARKKAGLSPSDFVTLTISTSSEGKAFVEEFMDELMSATLTKEVKFVDFGSDSKGDYTEINIGSIVFGLSISIDDLMK